MDSSTRNAARLAHLLRACETGTDARFPPTELFNEGWMLRLLLDAIETYRIENHPLSLEPDARWYSEARLGSPFRPRARGDALGEGFTNADGVLGHFDFHPATRAGLTLKPDATQFVVLEAKMFSNLSSGTKNARTYNQAARNVACIAKTIQTSGRALDDFRSIGFFVVAPSLAQRRAGETNLEFCMKPETVAQAVQERIAAYEASGRTEVGELRAWQDASFMPLLDRLSRNGRLAVLTWDSCIDAVAAVQPQVGEDLRLFYAKCLTFAPSRLEATTEGAV